MALEAFEGFTEIRGLNNSSTLDAGYSREFIGPCTFS